MSGRRCGRPGVAEVAIAAAATAVFVACGAAPHTRAAGAVGPMTVRAVVWNATEAPIGQVRAVADSGKVVVVFGVQAVATVLVSGAAVATVPSAAEWVGACVLPSLDGRSMWIVGIDGPGHLQRLRALIEFEDVSARYGFGGRSVRECATLDGQRSAFLLDDEVAVAGGGSAAFYGLPSSERRSLRGGSGGWGAVVASDTLVLFDAHARVSRTFPVPGIRYAAIGPDGRLYASTSRALYEAEPNGDLTLVYDAERNTLHGLTLSGQRVWFADGTELGVIERGHVLETSGAGLSPDAALSASPSGDVWVVGGGDRSPAIRRFARAEAEPPASASWSTNLGPIFARSCSPCHLATGVSGTDLSTADAWQRERAVIDERVVRRRSMPPEGHPLSDADRDTIRLWAETLR